MLSRRETISSTSRCSISDIAVRRLPGCRRRRERVPTVWSGWRRGREARCRGQRPPLEGDGEPALLAFLPGEQADGAAEGPGDRFRHRDRPPQFALVGEGEVGTHHLQSHSFEGPADTEGDPAENGHALETHSESVGAVLLGVNRLGDETEEEHVLRPGDEKIIFPLEEPDPLFEISRLPAGDGVLIHRSLPKNPGSPPPSPPARLPG